MKTEFVVTVNDVRLANAKLIAGVKPNFSRQPLAVQKMAQEFERTLPERIAEAGRQALHAYNHQYEPA